MVRVPPDWRAIHDELSGREPSSLGAAEFDLLAESLFWLDRPDESIAVLGRAFRAHVADGDHGGAVMAAWQLYYDHALVGEAALANGWLERARRHARHVEGTVAEGFLAVAEHDRASVAGVVDEALGHAERAVALAETTGADDLMAMALQARGRALVACGRIGEGLAALDEALATVANGEVAPLFVGWVYCNALSTCRDLADLRRAVEWNEAADRWCEQLSVGRLYPGICRLHTVELASLHGTWELAAAQAEQARDELVSHDPRYAGDAYYLIGELHRLRGDLDLAEEAFTAAHQLGRVPQPGLALARLAQGRVDAARTALRLALDPPPPAPLWHAQLLAASAEADLAAFDVDSALAVSAELTGIAEAVGSDHLAAIARVTEAAVLLAQGDPAGACRRAADAADRFRVLGLPYDEARARTVRGTAARDLGEGDTARLELAAARATFQRLGAEPDARHVAALVGEAPPSPLSARETEVLRLVAQGGTNKDVAAALVVSQHTVARHLSNIYTKLGVGSRSAAAAFARDHALI